MGTQGAAPLNLGTGGNDRIEEVTEKQADQERQHPAVILIKTKSLPGCSVCLPCLCLEECKQD